MTNNDEYSQYTEHQGVAPTDGGKSNWATPKIVAPLRREIVI
jgi:hypothetical protein